MQAEISEEIVKLFPSDKVGSVERGLWRIPVFFDRGFKRNRGSIRLRRYLVMMADSGAPVEELMDKTLAKYWEFSDLIKKYPADKETQKKRMEQLDKYMMDFIEEVGEHINTPGLRDVF